MDEVAAEKAAHDPPLSLSEGTKRMLLCLADQVGSPPRLDVTSVTLSYRRRRRGMLVDAGKEILAIQTDPGAVVSARFTVK